MVRLVSMASFRGLVRVEIDLPDRATMRLLSISLHPATLGAASMSAGDVSARLLRDRTARGHEDPDTSERVRKFRL